MLANSADLVRVQCYHKQSKDNQVKKIAISGGTRSHRHLTDFMKPGCVEIRKIVHSTLLLDYDMQFTNFVNKFDHRPKHAMNGG